MAKVVIKTVITDIAMLSIFVDHAKDYASASVGAGYWPLPTAIPIQGEKEQNAYRLDEFEDGSSILYLVRIALSILKNGKLL